VPGIIITFIIAIASGIFITAGLDNISSQSPQPSPNSQVEDVVQSPKPTPRLSPSAKPTPKPYAQQVNTQQNGEWGKPVKNDDGSYSMKVGMDERMSTANELYEALMNYRSVKGKSRLSWDDKLASYAQKRAAYICANGGDGHAGFYEYINNQGGYDELGYGHLGENMARMKMLGVHLVEWIYAQSPGHEANQVGDWSHVGVGISEYCSVVIFGGAKL